MTQREARIRALGIAAGVLATLDINVANLEQLEPVDAARILAALRRLADNLATRAERDTELKVDRSSGKLVDPSEQQNR